MTNIDNIIKREIEHKHNGGSVIKGKFVARFLNLPSNKVADVNFNKNNEVTMILLYSNSYNPYVRDAKQIDCNEETTDDEVYKTITEYLY